MTEGPARTEDGRLEAGIDLFNKGYFFEAHDVWEEIWTEDRTNSRKFYQGLIKVAGGFHHFQNDNLPGSVALLSAGLGHLEPYGENHGGIDLGRLRREVRVELEKVRRIGKGVSGGPAVAFPSIAAAPQ